VPIKFGTTTQEEEDGVDEEGKPKYKSVEVDNIINDTNPIWTKAPNELKDEDYLKVLQTALPILLKTRCSGST
jgi:molecular chaperone HtpG